MEIKGESRLHGTQERWLSMNTAFLLHIIRVPIPSIPSLSQCMAAALHTEIIHSHVIERLSDRPRAQSAFTFLFSFLLTETIWVLECGVSQHAVCQGFCFLSSDHAWVHGSGSLVLITECQGVPLIETPRRNSFLPFTAGELRLQEK